MVHRPIDCPSRDRNKCKVMNGSVSLAVSNLRENLARCYTQFCFSCACVGCVQVSVA